jgi:hypothetical protein
MPGGQLPRCRPAKNVNGFSELREKGEAIHESSKLHSEREKERLVRANAAVGDGNGDCTELVLVSKCRSLPTLHVRRVSSDVMNRCN